MTDDADLIATVIALVMILATAAGLLALIGWGVWLVAVGVV